MTETTNKHRPLMSGISIQAAKNDDGVLLPIGGSQPGQGTGKFGTLTELATRQSTSCETGCAPHFWVESRDSGQVEPYLNQGLISSLPNWRLSSIIWCASLAPSRG